MYIVSSLFIIIIHFCVSQESVTQSIVWNMNWIYLKHSFSFALRNTPAPGPSSPLGWVTGGWPSPSLTATARTPSPTTRSLRSALVSQTPSFEDTTQKTISGIDIKDIPNVNDRDFSVTLNGFFLVRWRDPRLIIDNVEFGDNEPLIPVDVSLVRVTLLWWCGCISCDLVSVIQFDPFSNSSWSPHLLVQNKLLNLSCQCQVGFAIILNSLHGWINHDDWS